MNSPTASPAYEGRGIYRTFGLSEDEVAANVWLRPETNCMPLKHEGEPGVVVVDWWRS